MKIIAKNMFLSCLKFILSSVRTIGTNLMASALQA